MARYTRYARKALRYSKYIKPVASRARVYGPAALQLAKDVAYLGSLVNSELHYYTLSTSNNMDTATAPFSLDAIAQGDTSVTRTGNSILPRYLSLRLHINKKIDPTSVAHETFRVMLFRWWGSSANAYGTCTQSDVLSSTGNPQSFLDQDITGKYDDFSRRIQVLRNEIFTLDNVSCTFKDFEWNIEINGSNTKKKKHSSYVDGTANNPSSGGFWILIMSDNASGIMKSAYYIDSKLSFYDN